MNNTIRYSIAGLGLALLVGAGFVLKNNWHHVVKEKESAAKVIPGREKYPNTGDNVLVWKPASESDGKLAVITPAKWNHTLKTVEVPGYKMTREGYANWETKPGRAPAWSNGAKLTWRFDKPGRAGPITVTFVFLDRKETWNITNGAARQTTPK